MKILVVNCGSSSLKYEVYAMPEQCSLGRGLIERIGLANGKICQHAHGKKLELTQDIPNHRVAFELMINAMLDPANGLLKSLSEIHGIGHRVVHGGEEYSASVLINDKVLKAIEDTCELAPLHNPANLTGILESTNAFPGIPQVAVFDTAFHQSLPPHAYLYGIPREFYDKYRIRRYGFHGTSHRYVSERAAEMLGTPLSNLKMITCHLGNGASIAAVKNGRSLDTSMGMTPIEGLMMGTRTGDLDIGAFLQIINKEELDISVANTLVNKHSGMLGVSGVSSDMRDVEHAAESGNERAKVTLEMYYYRIKKYIGAYAAAMGGVDAIVFTGGVGENDAATRSRSTSDMQFMGVEVDEDKNKAVRGKEAIISTGASKARVMVVPTNEELVIAQDTYDIVLKL